MPEYLVLAGVIALVAIASWRRFGGAITERMQGHANVVRTLEAQEARNGAPGTASSADPSAGNLAGQPVNIQCFAAETPVAAAEGSKPIAAVRVGDLVWSRDEQSGLLELRRVDRTFETPARLVISLRVARGDGDSEIIRATPGHPFWVSGRGWVAAERLSPGDPLSSSSPHELHVGGPRGPPERETVYNLEVEGFHTFFVGRLRSWVHNGGPADCGGTIIQQWNPINGPGPLGEDIAKTFRSATYTELVTTESTTLYRVYSDPNSKLGPYWTRTPPSGPVQAINDLALDQTWGNKATEVVSIQVPPGTRIFEGATQRQGGLVGGGNQVYIQHVEPTWEAPP